VEKYVDKGGEYKITAWVKLISPDSSQLQLSTQVGNGSSANYVNLSAKTIRAEDGWVQYEGTYRYNSIGGEYLTIYVESPNNATASFYIDDISFVPTGSGPVSIQKDLVPVKTAYEDDFLIGSAISAEDLEGVRLELLTMHHNVATAANAMKPDALQPTKGDFTFSSADALVDKVLAEGMRMHGHVLVWHQQSPEWMNTNASDGSPLSREEALVNLRAHIRTVMEHFGDKVISWDVVNEAMNDNPSNPTDWQASLRQSPWYKAIGPDYVEEAFLAAREVLDDHPDWNIKLYYNDYNEDNQNKAQAIAGMVKELNDRYAAGHPGKLLIDGVGMQAHYSINTNPDNVKLSLEKFISLGVEVSITELDIQAGSNYQLSEKQAEAQGYLYAQLMDLFRAHADHIARVTFWGMDDNTSWRASSNPLLFDKDLQAKQAYYGVIDPAKYMEEHAPDSSEANQANAAYGTPVIDGTIDAAWSQASELPINRYQMAWQGATGTAKALWDENYLYVLIQVSDSQLDKANPNAWEQDSVEIFLDPNNGKTSFYQEDDGQYRVNYENEVSVSPTRLAEGFASATKVSGTNYAVEAKIPIQAISPDNGKKLGFDVQINDAKDGARQSVAAWNDTTGTGYMDTSVFGVLTLTGKSSGPVIVVGGGTAPSAGSVENKDGVVSIKPEIKKEGNLATGIVSEDNLKKALEMATPAADGTKRIVVETPKQENSTAYGIQLPTERLQGKDSFVLTWKTGLAEIAIPSDMLPGETAGSGHAAIRVAVGSPESLDAATREKIGNRPVLELSLLVDGKETAWSNPNAPVAISIPYKPTAEELRSPDSIVVWYIDGEGKATPVPNGRYDAATGTVVFRATHFSGYAVAFVSKTFGDLANARWAKPAIEALAARDVIRGTSASTFAPSASITRKDFVALLVRSLELQDADFAGAGDGDGAAQSNAPFTREDMMVLTAGALKASGKPLEAGGTLDGFADAASLSADAKASAAALVKAGILNGKNGKLAPGDTLTRAEAAVIVYRIWNL